MNSILIVDEEIGANSLTEQEFELELSRKKETLMCWTILIASVTAFAICVQIAIS